MIASWLNGSGKVDKEDSLWSRLLYKKYMHNKDFFSTKGQGGSQFWKGLYRVKHLFKWDAVNKVGCGN
jgi:hypothetical protein